MNEKRASHAERIARLEVRVSNTERLTREIAESQHEIAATQIKILNELSRYRGAWGAIVLVVSAVAGAFALAKDWLWSAANK